MGHQRVAFEHYPDFDRFVPVLVIPILYAVLDRKTTIRILAQPGMGRCGLCSLFLYLVAYHRCYSFRWIILWRTDLERLGWNNCWTRHSGASHIDLWFCAGYCIYRQGCVRP